MADKKEEKAPAKEVPKDAGHAKPEKPGGMGAMVTKLPVMLGGVMVLEAVVLFGGFKFLGGGKPQVVVGADLVTQEAGEHGEAPAGEHGGDSRAAAGSGKHEKGQTVELNVVDMKAPNKTSGRSYIYDVSIFVSTKAESEEKVKSTLKSREALIKDRIRTIIAQSDPEKLGGGSEPGLETLRRQVKYQLDEIVGEGIIDEVLVPRCIPFRTD